MLILDLVSFFDFLAITLIRSRATFQALVTSTVFEKYYFTALDLTRLYISLDKSKVTPGSEILIVSMAVQIWFTIS